MKRPRQQDVVEVDNIYILNSTSKSTVLRKIPGLKDSRRQKEVLGFLQLDDEYESLVCIRNLLTPSVFNKWKNERLALRIGNHLLGWDGSISLSEPLPQRRKQALSNQQAPSRRFSNPGETRSSDVHDGCHAPPKIPTESVLPMSWGSDKLLLIKVDDTLCPSSLHIIPDPNFGTFLLTIDGPQDPTYALASALKRESFDTFTGPVHMGKGAIIIRVKIPFLGDFERLRSMKISPSQVYSSSPISMKTQLRPFESPEGPNELEISSNEGIDIDPLNRIQCSTWMVIHHGKQIDSQQLVKSGLYRSDKLGLGIFPRTLIPTFERFVASSNRDPGPSCRAEIQLVWCHECGSYMELKKIEEIHEGGAICDECDVEIDEGLFWHCKNCFGRDKNDNDAECGYDLCKNCGLAYSRGIKEHEDDDPNASPPPPQLEIILDGTCVASASGSAGSNRQQRRGDDLITHKVFIASSKGRNNYQFAADTSEELSATLRARGCILDPRTIESVDRNGIHFGTYLITSNH